VGQPLSSMFGYKTNGIWQTGEPCPLVNPAHCVPGEWRYVDVNGDGAIDGADRTIIGSAEPDFFGGLNNHFAFGRFNLDVLLQGSFGNDVLNANAVYLKSLTTASNEYASSFERWTPQNPSNTVPRAHLGRERRL